MWDRAPFDFGDCETWMPELELSVFLLLEGLEECFRQFYEELKGKKSMIGVPRRPGLVRRKLYGE
jgi:hypothetical protein